MIQGLLCNIFGHSYIVERKLNYGARKVGCLKCNKHWAMHDVTRSFLPWDEEFEELYATGGMLASEVDEKRKPPMVR